MPEIIWDTKSLYVYQQTEEKKFRILDRRYRDFLKLLNDVNTQPVKVYDDLRADQLAELELIREVSKKLHRKKDEDISKQKAAAEETVTEDKEKTKESNDNVPETKTTEAQ